MTKNAMINYIEETNFVRDFSRSHFNKMLKERVEHFYKMAIEYRIRYGMPV